MNRYPLWKYLIVLVALLLGILYTLPNFFGESPAVQVTSTNVTRKVDENTLRQIENLLAQEQIPYTGAYYSMSNSIGNVRVRFATPDLQLKAKDVIEKALIRNPEEPEYTVALNLLSDSPDWLTALNARPMFLGLDLRGGVHFLLQVDMDGALESRYDTLSNDVRNNLRTRGIDTQQVSREGSSIQALFASAAARDQALGQLRTMMPELSFSTSDRGSQYLLIGEINESEIIRIQETALRQNIITLHNRINELGVAEPVIQQQGNDRIVVQLPGIQDVARAKEILGRTATLQLRMVEDSPTALAAIAAGTVPFGMEAFKDTDGQTILLRRQVLLTGENLKDATAGRNPQSQQPTVNLSLDDNGARIFRETTRNNIGKRIAIVLFENNRGQVVTAPVIRSEIPNGQVEISGSMSLTEAADTALLLRAGSLAAPMSIIEERTIGPSLGAENIEKGFKSTLWGFVAIAIFMIIYYHLFGLFSTLGLVFNVVLLLALLSLLQATLTLPGIAAIALTLGMAIDANVLINERIREELRHGATPQQAINIGFDRAWGTIFDSNLTSLIVGIALLAFSGPGPIRGFAIVHCLGILTSMFSSVVGVRALVNLWYGGRRGVKKLAIGTVWRDDNYLSNKPHNKSAQASDSKPNKA
ncbi:preprotein translocase subunit SecD [Oligella sp. HMSC05A10]|uniref:protein translocase subunit SecD n=1 Tax=Oligella TaxID=90243 RepID=UPI00037CFE3B|nr:MULTISPECIES: protein translocase subunit SecD [Oligella]OFS83812.1 preprotein translocase subunit SecD [Oligella sp. HMSC05A10]SUA54084.1 preprotein translocase subunit SecD [Oligella urethralis]SUA59443.1 preprotein translocase subunit SecD [Oligella urethralis]SUA62236.1 preprotein translocase subunit SecD [Oligella urethralis]SUA68476.1 preprotein translocase subunit SecD [Oligella urethralis]